MRKESIQPPVECLLPTQKGTVANKRDVGVRNSHAEGFQPQRVMRRSNTRYNSHAEGEATNASGGASHAEGLNTTASGDASHAEGNQTTASGFASHAEGFLSTASEQAAHAEGFFTTASNFAAHAEGSNTISTGVGSHSEGQNSQATGSAAHSEGSTTLAQGIASHAEGTGTQALGNNSHAEGFFTSTLGFENVHIMGRSGDAEEAHSWFIGNGTNPLSDRALGAKWLASSGDMFVDGAFVPGGADYAEMFETLDGKAIDVGYFVTTEGDKIRKATGRDTYILGVTSATPGIIGDSGEMRWKGKFVIDEWERIQHHEVILPAEKDKEGNIIILERKEMQPVLNPEWDPQREYIPRKKRLEWVPVGMIGKVLVRDDGSCEIDGYCMPNDEGIATNSEQGYRVIKRTGENQVLVLLNSVPANQSNLVKELKELAKLKEQITLLMKNFSSENKND